MKKTRLALLLGVVFSLLLANGLVERQPSYAHMTIDCELQRFYDFLDADAQYTTTFRSWYHSDPTSCGQECVAACNQISDPNARQSCMNNILTCASNCDVSRHNAFLGAQNDLSSIAFRDCPANPNVCGEAYWNASLCNSVNAAHWENPVYDANGNIDGTWMSYVFQEFMACRAASGIDNCQ